MPIKTEFGLVGAQRADHHIDGSVRAAFATVAPDVNPELAQALRIETGFDPNGPAGMA